MPSPELVIVLAVTLACSIVRGVEPQSNLEILKSMFSEMVEKKDVSKAADFYHPDFVMEANGMTQDYAEFTSSHAMIYGTAIQYAVRIDEKTVVESEEKIAARVYITTTMPDEEPKEIEVILIAEMKDGLIQRLWELAWPDWTQMKNFRENYLAE